MRDSCIPFPQPLFSFSSLFLSEAICLHTLHLATLVLPAMSPLSGLGIGFGLGHYFASVLYLCTLSPTSVLGAYSVLLQVPGLQHPYRCRSHSAVICPAVPLPSLTGTQNSISWEVQRFDGWYNNLMEHKWGSKGR